MPEHEALLNDVFRIQRTRPSRHVFAGELKVNSTVENFLSPIVKKAAERDGAVAYITVDGRTFRLTIERL